MMHSSIRCNPSYLVVLSTLCIAAGIASNAIVFYFIALGFCLLALVQLGVDDAKLNDMNKICRELANGNMESRVNVNGRVNFVRLGNSINAMVDVADAYIRESKASAEHAAQGKFYRKILLDGLNGNWKLGANALNNSTTQIRQNLINTAQQAADNLEASVMKIIESLNQSTDTLVNTGKDLNIIVSRNNQATDSLTNISADTSQTVNSIAAATEEMTAAIKEISAQVQGMSNLALDTERRSTEVRQTLNSLTNTTEQVRKISELIKSIADQVNLLSLNATIEAERAGEAGLGFAVVATEVKGLAQRTADATSNVEDFIKRIRSDVDVTKTSLEELFNDISKASSAAALIAAAIEEQNATTQEISHNLQKTNLIMSDFSLSVVQVADNSKQTSASSEAMTACTKSLLDISQNLNTGIQQFIVKLKAS